MITFVMSNDGVTVFFNKALVVSKDNPYYKDLLRKLKDPTAEFQDIKPIIDLVEVLTQKTKNTGLVITPDEVRWNDMVLEGNLVDRILALMHQDAEDPELNSLKLFLENLMQNPDKVAIKGLFDFLGHCNLPITTDGCFLAYKAVKDNYYDHYTGTFDNHIGCKPSMSRSKCDPDPNSACSTGLHVCSYNYLQGYFGSEGHIMVVRVHPKDVVAVPKDHGNEKMRVCEYEVVGEIPQATQIKDEYITKEYSSNPCVEVTQGIENPTPTYNWKATHVDDGESTSLAWQNAQKVHFMYIPNSYDEVEVKKRYIEWYKNKFNAKVPFFRVRIRKVKEN